MRIAICGNISNGKGLERDYKMLRAFCEARGHQVVGVERTAGQAPPSDLLILLEELEPRFLGSARTTILVVNPEWFTDAWKAHLPRVDLVLCKTKEALRIFQPLVGPKAAFLGWAAEDRYAPQEARKVEALHVAGGSLMKGTVAVLGAWERYPSGLPPLHVVGNIKMPSRPRGVTFHGRLPDAELRALQNRCAIHVQPSETEGYGHGLHESLSCAAVLLTTGAPPMDEVGAPKTIPITSQGKLRLADTYQVGAEAVASAVRWAASLLGWELDTLGAAARERYLASRAEFEGRLESLLKRETMDHPRLTIAIPAHPSRGELLRRTLLSLASQDCEPGSFEVVIGVDGGGDICQFTGSVNMGSADVTVVDSPRPRGDVPHRNHARNAAWRAGRGEWVWIVDCDFLFPPQAVRHLLAEADQRTAQGKIAAFSPIMHGVGGIGPADWLARSAHWDVEDFAGLRETWTDLDPGIYSGYPDRYTGPGTPASEPCPEMKEGMPCLPRGLLEVMGGFDEAFGEWGGDKEEFVDRLKGLMLAGLVEVRLLTSVSLLHQPHDRDPDAFSEGGKRRQRERERRIGLMRSNSSWWRAQLENARDRMPEVLASIRGIPEQDFSQGWKGAPSGWLPVGPEVPSLAAKAVHLLGGKRGRVGVLGPGRERVALALCAGGNDARPIEESELGERNFHALVGVDLLGPVSDSELEGRAARLRAAVGSGGKLLLFERTKLGGRGPGLRAPLDYQRLLPGLSVRGNVDEGGERYTVFSGALVRG